MEGVCRWVRGHPGEVSGRGEGSSGEAARSDWMRRGSAVGDRSEEEARREGEARLRAEVEASRPLCSFLDWAMVMVFLQRLWTWRMSSWIVP